jgi:4-amino-4-deoxy-L-arabinose transferase-like glycosyltransferase
MQSNHLQGGVNISHPHHMTPSASPFQELSESLGGLYTPVRAAVVLGLALLGFLLVINGSWKATPDSALYLELGESLHRGSGYVFNGEPHTYVPPGYPSMVAFAAYVLGEGFRSYRILMALLGALTALAGYLFVRLLCGPDTGLLLGGLFALNHVLLHNATYTTSDVPFALLTLIALNTALYAAPAHGQRWGAVMLAGLLAGLPALLRVNGWGIPPAVAMFLYCASPGERFGRRALPVVVFIVCAMIPGLSWEAYKAAFPPSLAEGTYLNVMSGRSVWTHLQIVLTALWEYGHETTYAMTGAALKTGFLEFICPVIALLGLVKAWQKGERLLVPLTVIQFAGLLLAPAGSRYILALIPALYLFFALAVLHIAQWLSGRGTWAPSSRNIVVGCFVLFAVLNAGQNVMTVVGARTALEANGAESERDLPFFQAGRWLRQHGGNAVVLSMHPRIVHYLSGLPTAELVRSGVPEQEVWTDSQEQIHRAIEKVHPAFLFSDSSNRILYDPVMQAIKGMHLTLEEIPEVNAGNRFRLWRIVYPRPTE